MKKFKILICTVLSLLCLFLCSCNKYVHPEYSSAYTTDYHLNKIEERVNRELVTRISKEEVTDITVDVVYSFSSNSPEFFVIDIVGINYKQDSRGATYGRYSVLNRAFILGYILNDKYYLIGQGVFNGQRSPYDAFDYNDSKKYFGKDCFAVEIDGKIYKIAEINKDGECKLAPLEELTVKKTCK